MNEANCAELLPRADLVAMIEAAAIEVFETMLNLVITPERMQTEPVVAAPPPSSVVSIIGLAGAWAGTGCVACSGALACRWSSQFLSAETSAVNDEVLDSVGEIANMIIGNVKTALEDRIGPMGLSTPTVIFGRNFQTRSARLHDWTVVPFLCENERFYVQFSIAPNGDTSRGTLRAGYQLPQVLHL